MSSSDNQDDEPHPPSDYVGTLLRDPTSSHLLETLVRRLPEGAFDAVWATYLAGKLGRLAVHPVANFVVAKALERVNERRLQQACEELEGAAGKIYSQCSRRPLLCIVDVVGLESSRTGVFRAMIERAASLKAHEPAVLEVRTSLRTHRSSAR